METGVNVVAILCVYYLSFELPVVIQRLQPPLPWLPRPTDRSEDVSSSWVINGRVNKSLLTYLWCPSEDLCLTRNFKPCGQRSPRKNVLSTGLQSFFCWSTWTGLNKTLKLQACTRLISFGTSHIIASVAKSTCLRPPLQYIPTSPSLYWLFLLFFAIGTLYLLPSRAQD